MILHSMPQPAITVISTLAQFSICTLICAVCPLFIYRLLKQQSRLRLPNQMGIHLSAWLAFMLTAVGYAGPHLILWRGMTTTYNITYTRLSGSLNMAAMTITPLSALFLTVDRIITLCRPNALKDHRRERATFAMSAILVFTFVYAFALSFPRSWAPGERTHCLTLGCMQHPRRIRILMIARLAFGWTNVVLGSIFAFVLHRIRRQFASKAESRHNCIVLMVIVNEFALNVLPTTNHFVCGLLEVRYAAVFGPLLTTANSIDALVTTIVFWKARRAALSLRGRSLAIIPGAFWRRFVAVNEVGIKVG